MAEYVSRDDVRRFIADAFSKNRFATNYDYAILFDEIDEIPAADVQPIDRWISVNDKLPEQDEKVLVLTKDKDIMTMIYKVIPFRWYKPKFGGFDKDYVTHWKPSKDGDTE